jgi:hypothetical protein
MQLKYIQLQIKALDRKMNIVEKQTVGVSFKEFNEDQP